MDTKKQQNLKPYEKPSFTSEDLSFEMQPAHCSKFPCANQQNDQQQCINNASRS